MRISCGDVFFLFFFSFGSKKGIILWFGCIKTRTRIYFYFSDRGKGETFRNVHHLAEYVYVASGIFLDEGLSASGKSKRISMIYCNSHLMRHNFILFYEILEVYSHRERDVFIWIQCRLCRFVLWTLYFFCKDCMGTEFFLLCAYGSSILNRRINLRYIEIGTQSNEFICGIVQLNKQRIILSCLTFVIRRIFASFWFY